MKKKIFKGFNENQMVAVAKKLGYEGPLEKFNDFLRSSPEAAAKFGLLSQKARQIAEGIPSFSRGGVVPAKKDVSKKKTPAPSIQQIPFAKSSTATDKLASSRSAGSVPSGAIASTSLIKENSNQLISSGTGALKGATPTVSTPNIPQAEEIETAGYDASTSTGQVKKEAAQFDGAQGRVSQQGLVKAATQDPNTLAQLDLKTPQISEKQKREATVQQQLVELNKQFDGEKPPAWAAGALRQTHAAMAARGIDSSSMAAQAATQAAMEAATAIAAADAQLLGQTNLANLDVRKSKMLSDAAAMSAMDLANLNNRQQAAVENAKAFLEMDFKNLDNKQQAEIFSFQSVVNSLLSDAAQENAAKQFNAASENQMSQFFGQLSTSIDIARAELQSDTNQFNATMRNQREQFNAVNALAIAQANTQWRQQITTANNAAQNLTNQLNATTIARMSEVGFNAMIQLERDEMNYINDALTRATQVNENAAERENRLLIASLDRDAAKRLADQGYKFEAGKAIGGALTGLAVDGIRSLFDW